MDNKTSDSRIRQATLPNGFSAEIKFERAGDKIQAYTSYKTSNSSGSGNFWWHRCSEFGCFGEAVHPGRQCLRHLEGPSRATYLVEAIRAGRLSLRGVEVSQSLWDEIHHSPVFINGAPCVALDFSGAEINAEIRLTKVEFEHSLLFVGSSLFAIVEMRECAFHQAIDLRHARCKAPINFFKSVFESTVDMSYLESDQSVGFESAKMNSNLSGDGSAATTHLSNATILGNVSFRHSRSWLLLNRAQLHGLLDIADAELVAFHGEQLSMSVANRFGPCRIGNVYMPRATIASRIHMDVHADTVDLSDAILKEGGLIELDKAKLTLRQLSLGGPLRVAGKLLATDMPEVIGLVNADAGKMSFARVNLSRCSMYGAHGLSTLDLESTVKFPKCPWWAARRLYLADEWAWRAARPGALRFIRWKLSGVRIGNEHERPLRGQEQLLWLPSLRASQIAGTYRDLRRALESKSDMPGASDFYYGEIEMRRNDENSSIWDRVLVTLYWLLSGYGLRTGRSLAAFLILISLATWGMRFDGFASGSYSIARGFIFSLRASLPGFSTVEVLSPVGQSVEISARVTGTIIVALLILSLRTRLMRKPGE